MSRTTRVDHSVFCKENIRFKDACSKVGIEPTKRQASKWRNRKGLAYRTVILKEVLV